MAAVREMLAAAEGRVDAMLRGAKRRLGLADPVTVLPFRGYGTAERLGLRGRVLEVTGLEQPGPDDSLWQNLVRMLHRYESDEIGGARVRARFGDREVELTTDREGFFALDLDVELDPDPPPEQRWRAVELELIEPLLDGQEPVQVTGRVLTPPRSAQLGVISDVDDTIVRTGANSALKHWRTVLLNNAHTRTAFPGLPAFYRALERGTRGAAINPIFYVSSSPWNLFDLFERFLELQDIPLGPFALKDFGLTRDQWLKGSHHDHKTESIESLFETYPELSFVLIGDSGQKDVEIYREIVRRHPDRVLAVYIRDVTGDERDREARALLDEVRDAGVQAAFGEDLLAAAANAADRGWIEPAAVDDVRREVG